MKGAIQVGRVLLLMMLIITMVTSCRTDKGTESEKGTTEILPTETEKKAEYISISAEQAKHLMDTEKGYVILDVRTEEEYNESHIPDAILIPDCEIMTKAEQVLTDKEQLILVYCRSGRRSKNASQALAELGYTNVKEFGGIIDWPYETE